MKKEKVLSTKEIPFSGHGVKSYRIEKRVSGGVVFMRHVFTHLDGWIDEKDWFATRENPASISAEFK